jgi:hypothetical protein
LFTRSPVNEDFVMKTKHMGLLFTILAWLASSAMAGPTRPTWGEFVEVDTFLDTTTFTTMPIQGDSFSVANFIDARAGGGTEYMALIDYQAPVHPWTVNVIAAYWGSAVSYPLSLSISPFPSSPAPPQITDWPVGSGGGTMDIAAGDYTSSPLEILGGGPTTGDFCFLLQTYSSISLSSAVISFSFGPNSVPEPPGLVLASIASLAFVGGRLIRRRTRSRATRRPPKLGGRLEEGSS